MQILKERVMFHGMRKAPDIDHPCSSGRGRSSQALSVGCLEPCVVHLEERVLISDWPGVLKVLGLLSHPALGCACVSYTVTHDLILYLTEALWCLM